MRYRVLVYAGLAFVLSMPAEAQKLQMALAAAADFTPVYAFVKIPANIRGIIALAEFGNEKPKELVASYFKVGDNPGIGDEKVAEQKQAVGDSPQVVLPYTASGDWTPGKYRLDVSADEQPGYIIVMEQPTMARTITRERDIIPGLGINREIFVDQTGSGCDLVSSGVRAYRRTDDVRH